MEAGEPLRLRFEALDPDLEPERDREALRDFDLDLERDLLPPDEDELAILRLFPPASPSLSSPPLAILSFSSSLSSEDDTIAFETIFFFCRVDRPSICSLISLRRRMRSAFFAALLLIFLDLLRPLLSFSPDFLASPPASPPFSASLPEETISPSSLLFRDPAANK